MSNIQNCVTSSYDKGTILQATNGGLDIFQREILDLPAVNSTRTVKNFISPVRDERTPSANLYNNNGTWYLKDHGGEGEHLDVFAFIGKKYALSFPEVLEKLGGELGMNSKAPIIQFKKYSEQEAEFWKCYGITSEVLRTYKVKAVHSFESKTKDDKPFTVTASDSKPIFSYQINQFCFKIYQPNTDYKFSWLGIKPVNYAFGLELLPEKGERVFISAGEKDALTLISHGYNAICFNSESANPSAELVEQLKQRFSDVVVIYDIDSTGLKCSEKLCKAHGLKRVLLPEEIQSRGLGKDVSDYFKAFHDGSLVFDNSDILYKGSFDDLINKAESFTIETLPQEAAKETGFEMDFNYKKKFTKPALSLNGVSLMNIGEVFTLVALPGSGKSQTIETIAAGYIAKREAISIDSFGFYDNVPNEKGCLVIDMERPHDQCKDGYDRIYKRLNHNISVVSDSNVFKHLLYKCWIDFNGVKERKEAFETLVSTGNYGLVMLDGILGIVNDFNDNKECSEVIQWVIGLANKYQFALIITMHPNKGTETMAGHIGGFLYRYSRACLLLRSNTYDKEVKEITSDFAQQKVSYGGKVCSMFRYSEEAGMFIAEESAPEPTRNLNAFSSSTIEQMFNEFLTNGFTRVPMGKAKARLSELIGKGIETAKKHIEAAYEAGILDRSGQGRATVYFLTKGENE